MTRVLIIEDSRTQALHLKMLLERHGYRVDMTFDAPSGLESCRRNRPDLVLCDVVMPGMDGYAFTRTVKDDPSLQSIPIVLVTALENPRDVIRAVEAGADNYVTKPYHEERLMTRLARILAPDPSDSSYGLRAIQSEDLPAGTLVDVLVSCLEDAVERNRELTANKEELARTNAQREELMRIVAHELRAPLQSLSMRAALMREVPNNAKLAAELPTAIDRQVRAMVRIIDDLFDLTALDLGTLRLEQGMHRVDKLVTRVVNEFQMQHPDRRLTCQCVDNAHVELNIDPSRIQQVVANFVSNAVKYSENGTPIEVEVFREHDLLRVQVRDFGVGIPEDKRTQVFDRYFRVSPDTPAKGIGLGLYICRRIMELHEGDIGVDSRSGTGSTFWFRLPIPSGVRSTQNAR